MNTYYIKKILIYPFILTIKFYKFFLSPILKTNCRHLPTCSDYGIESLTNYGLLKGSFLMFKRILRCHPFGTHGYDPVPKKIKKEF